MWKKRILKSKLWFRFYKARGSHLNNFNNILRDWLQMIITIDKPPDKVKFILEPLIYSNLIIKSWREVGNKNIVLCHLYSGLKESILDRNLSDWVTNITQRKSWYSNVIRRFVQRVVIMLLSKSKKRKWTYIVQQIQKNKCLIGTTDKWMWKLTTETLTLAAFFVIASGVNNNREKASWRENLLTFVG